MKVSPLKSFNKTSVDTDFSAWFKGSKVVDASGAPLVVFHATDHDFSVEDFKALSHFGSAEVARYRYLYKGSKGKSWRTYPVFLNIKNPLYIHDLKEHSVQRYYDELMYIQGFKNHEIRAARVQNALIPFLQNKGYDGFVYINEFEDRGSQSFIIFDKSQVRSALDLGANFTKNTRYEKHFCGVANKLSK